MIDSAIYFAAAFGAAVEPLAGAVDAEVEAALPASELLSDDDRTAVELPVNAMIRINTIATRNIATAPHGQSHLGIAGGFFPTRFTNFGEEIRPELAPRRPDGLLLGPERALSGSSPLPTESD